MADPLTRPTPSLPAAARPRPPAAATPATVAEHSGHPYDRHAFEQAIRASELRPDVRLVAMMLAHCARPTGVVSGDVLTAARLAKACGLRPDDRVRGALTVLERRGYLTRPPVWRTPTGYAPEPRPVTLTLPPGYVPPHPGGRP